MGKNVTMAIRWYLLAFTVHCSLITIHCHASAFEDIGVGARGRGMQGAFSSVVDDASAIFWNPAALSRINKKEFTAFYQDLYSLGLVNYNAIGYAFPRVGGGTIGFGWTRLGTTGSVTFMNYAENTYSFSYGREIGRSFSLGANLKYYSVAYDNKASGLGLDAAAMYEFVPDKFKASFVWYNINNPLIYWDTKVVDTLPAVLRLGLGYSVAENHGISVEANRQIDKKTHGALGWESWFFDRGLGVRAGISDMDGQINSAAGLSIGFNKLRLDYTLERNFKLGYSSLINLTVGF